MHKIILSEVPLFESASSEGEVLLLKLKELSLTCGSVHLDMSDYVKFCFNGSPKVEFKEPTDNQVMNKGLYGTVNGMKVFIGKGVEEGTVLVNPKILN